MQQMVCGLTFEDTLNDAHTGDKMVLEIALHVCIHPTITRKCLKHLLSLFANFWHLIKAEQQW